MEGAGKFDIRDRDGTVHVPSEGLYDKSAVEACLDAAYRFGFRSRAATGGVTGKE